MMPSPGPEPGAAAVPGARRGAGGAGICRRARDTLARGHDHTATLDSAHNLAAHLCLLGDVQAAHDLAQDALDRRRRVLDEDHPDTLESADDLAADLRALAEADDNP